MAFEIGDTVGDYKIIDILGAGGMGKVYKVKNTISDRVEAMKVLLPNLTEAPELADRFMREIKLLASLDHPNIAALHTALRNENQLLMVMEYVEGKTLDERLKDGPLTVWDAVDYLSQVLSALGYAHERGVIHRDVKPANMMVTPKGVVKLMDFGIAKATADRRLTATGATLGSLFYMSPEQVKGSSDIDGRSDLYSVGVALYEAVTGTRPFKGDSDYSIMVAHLEQQPVPPIQMDPTLPDTLNALIMMAIEKDPALRFQSAEAFRGALESVKQNLVRPADGKPPIARAVHTPGPMAPTQTAGVLKQPPVAPVAPPPPPPSAAQPMAYAAPVQPPMAAPAPPQAYPPPPPAAGGSSHRGLWMALGGLVVVGLLAVAAIYLPGWYRARAGSSATPVVVDTQKESTEQKPPADTAPPPADTSAQPPADASTQPATEQAGQPAGESKTAAEGKPATGGVSGARQPSSGSASRGRAVPSGGRPPQMQETSQPTPPTTPAKVEPPPPPPVDQEALDRAREKLGMLGARVNAVRGSLQNLEQQQRSMGVGLRTDISASWKRMEFLMDEAEAALKRQDLAAAKRNMERAERETDKLEQFLGR